MRIGVKYCGGCNPRFDRSRMVEDLLETLLKQTDRPSLDVTYDPSLYCPVWLVVCGCQSACVETGSLQAGKVITVSSAKEFYPLKSRLAKLLTENLSESEHRLLRIRDKASSSRIFTQEDLVSFARLSGDRNGIHLDPDVAQRGIFLRPVVHGCFVGTLFSEILGTKLPGSGTILLEEKMEYLAPVYVGEEIRAELTFTEVTERKSAYLGTFEGECRKGDGTCVIKGTFRELMSKKFFTVEEPDTVHECEA